MTQERRNQFFIGSAIILIGAAMALDFAGITINDHSPWFVFGLFVPAAWALIYGWERYWQHGRVFDFGAVWVFAPLIITLFLILNINWVYLSIIFIVLVGLSFIFGRQATKPDKR